MDEPQESILIDKDLRPTYYDHFRCLAKDCRFSCCKDWNIAFNKKDYLALKRQKGSPELESRLKKGVRRVSSEKMAEKFYGEFGMSGGACPLLREDGLCLLQVENGHEVLPFVCRQYPRAWVYRPSGYLERSLTTSCEAVLELLWDLPEGISFVSDPLPRQEEKRLYSHTGNPLALRFAEVREWCVDVLQDCRFSLPERIMLMGIGLQRLTETEDAGAWLPWARSLPDNAEPGSLLIEADDKTLTMLLMDMKRILGPFVSEDQKISVTIQRAGSNLVRELEIPQHGRLTRLQEATQDVLGSWKTVELQPYRDARARYESRFGDREYFLENLMVNTLLFAGIPNTSSAESLWKSYVNFCNLYACHRFAAVISCRKGVEDCRQELFDLLAQTSRALLHNKDRQNKLQEDFFQNDSATLAHMAILLSG